MISIQKTFAAHATQHATHMHILKALLVHTIIEIRTTLHSAISDENDGFN